MTSSPAICRRFSKARCSVVSNRRRLASTRSTSLATALRNASTPTPHVAAQLRTCHPLMPTPSLLATVYRLLSGVISAIARMLFNGAKTARSRHRVGGASIYGQARLAYAECRCRPAASWPAPALNGISIGQETIRQLLGDATRLAVADGDSADLRNRNNLGGGAGRSLSIMVHPRHRKRSEITKSPPGRYRHRRPGRLPSRLWRPGYPGAFASLPDAR